MMGRILTLIALCGTLVHCGSGVPASAPHSEFREPASGNEEAAPSEGRQELVSAALDDLATAALAQGDVPSSSVVSELRRRGQPALDALIHRAERAGLEDDTADSLIDRVAAQRYARHSGLYWHTDLELALNEAKRTERPVLSLRMLGRLTDELSCANSRFFRVVLYPDPAVSKLLRDRFVLHWSSERPAPKITVDYGDGRRLVRTITGNSAHYLLSADGRVLHVLPGLYHPDAFREQLESALTAQERGRAAPRELARWHRRQAGELARSEAPDLPAAVADPEDEDPTAGDVGSIASAASAIPIAATKSAVEAPLAMPTFVEPEAEAVRRTARWEDFAESELRSVRLSNATLELMRKLSRRGIDEQGRLSPLNTPEFEQMVARFRRTLALDTVRNRHDLERKVHLHLAQSPLPDFSTLNHWVYEELFLTSASDPWLGLAADGVFTALPEQGVESQGVER